MSDGPQSGDHKALHQESEPQKCFIAHSYEAEWHDTIEGVCNKLLPKYGLQPWYAEYNYDPTTTLRDKIVCMIDSAPYGIYDLSYWHANKRGCWVMPCNVLIELGIAIALNRPTLLLRHTGNRIAKLELPRSIQSVTQICEFTGGDYSLGNALREHLSHQANLPTDGDWQHHHCRFGEIDCSYLQVYPHTAMISHDKLHCHIADGPDTDQLDFRHTVEKVLGHFNNISYSYLDKGGVPSGYMFLLCAHCQLIRSTPFAVYRITPDTSPDTYIAIGISIGLEYRFHYKIPRFMITKDMQYVPSLLQGYEFVLMKNLHTLKTRLPQFVQHILTKIDEPAYWKPQVLPFETRVPLDSETAYEDKVEETPQAAERDKEPVLELWLEDLKKILDNIENNEYLENSKLAETQYVTLNQKTNPQTNKGVLVRALLKAGFERMRPSGMRNDSAPKWRHYNILYYHYFQHHLANSQTSGRLGIGSMRQFYREQDRALQALRKEILDLVLPFEPRVPLGAEETPQEAEQDRKPVRELSPEDLRDVLNNIDDNEYLENSRLAEMHYITLSEKAKPQANRGTLIRDLLKAGFARMQAGGMRNDSAPEWRPYNILYYHYFRYHLANSQTSGRLGIGSIRQFYREQDRAIQTLLKEILALEQKSLKIS